MCLNKFSGFSFLTRYLCVASFRLPFWCILFSYEQLTSFVASKTHANLRKKTWWQNSIVWRSVQIIRWTGSRVHRANHKVLHCLLLPCSLKSHFTLKSDEMSRWWCQVVSYSLHKLETYLVAPVSLFKIQRYWLCQLIHWLLFD